MQERIASAAQVAQLYASRKKVYPQSVSGTYRNIKWAVLLIALAIYYFTPFLRWDRGLLWNEMRSLVGATSS